MAQDPLVGRTIAGYTLKRAVGEGGTAQVYQAEHPERGTVALKVLRPRLAQDPVAVKRFLREAEFGARVVHPNVVRTFDFGEADGVYYLALEWAAGEPLELFLTRSGKLAPPVAAKIIEQLGAALEEAHRAGIIHRDLKPANIMYDPAEQRTRLLDFGIARDAEIGAEERLTRAGSSSAPCSTWPRRRCRESWSGNRRMSTPWR
jgi:serine/threonine-protein kinase